jgi:hypothetical protein
MVFSLCACSGGIQEGEAKDLINRFFDAIETEDYELAATFLHPERPADLKVFFEGLENEKGLDFSNIEIDKYTAFSSSYYDSTVAGSTYTLGMDTNVNGEDMEIEIEIVKNDNGYGIYNLDITP